MRDFLGIQDFDENVGKFVEGWRQAPRWERAILKFAFVLLLLTAFLASGNVKAQQPQDNLPEPLQIARLNAINIGGGVPATGDTFYCDSVTDSDLLCEDFAGVGYRAMTEVVKTTDRFNEDATLTNTGSLSCSQTTGLDGTLNSDETLAYYSIGTDLYVAYAIAYFQIKSEELENTESESICSFGENIAGSANTVNINVHDNAGTIEIRPFYRDETTSAFVEAVDSTKSISLNTWYRIKIQLDSGQEPGSDVLKVWVSDTDGSNETQVTNKTNLNITRDCDYFLIGDPSVSSGDDITFEFMGVKIDSSEMPGGCL